MRSDPTSNSMTGPGFGPGSVTRDPFMSVCTLRLASRTISEPVLGSGGVTLTPLLSPRGLSRSRRHSLHLLTT